MKNRIALVAIALGAMSFASAGVPAGYYDGAENKGGKDLLVALYNKISDHTAISYKNLWTTFKTTDVYPDGKLWDMYSTKHWTAGSEQCGNYSSIGDCYNREHSFPKSWFNDATPMYSDIFHLYPTDGYVNNQRGNNPFGECENGTYVPSKGSIRPLGRLGLSTFPGYSGTVWEPDDQYKGDFARSYFYMAAAYYNRIGTWNSDMLAGNSYPAFSDWAVNLLLKWHRMDPVSDKETARNDAAYSVQHNRNPFIDHPEMVEYIWGDLKTSQWTSSAGELPVILQPGNESTINFGTTSTGIAATRELYVETRNVTGNVTITSSSALFTVSATSLSAEQTNAQGGMTLTLTYLPTSAGSHSATVTVSTAGATAKVNLAGSAVDGLAAGEATYVSASSFQANWTYCGDDIDGRYRLTVGCGTETLEGYPVDVDARAGQYTVTDLDPETEYWYTLSSKTLVSNRVTVRTGNLVPSVSLLFDGDLFFTSTPGEPSAAAEILIEMTNITEDVTLMVSEPFEVSADGSVWDHECAVSPDVERFWLRMNATAAGSWTSMLYAIYKSQQLADIEVKGAASLSPTFIETFEADATGMSTYNPSSNYVGNACEWILSEAGIYSGDTTHDGHGCVRFSKKDTSSITMASDKKGGIGTVSFWASSWNATEGDADVAVQLSTDGGETFRTIGTVTVKGGNYEEYSVFAGIAAPARLRLQQTSGKRILVDDVTMTDHNAGVSDMNAERHRWNVVSTAGSLTVSTLETMEISVYAIDGLTVYSGTLEQGEYSFDVAPGLYIVASPGHSRRVIVR